MPLDSQTLKNIIVRADPREAVKRFRTAGTCGNEGIFLICQLLKSEGLDREDATPYLKAWFNHWKICLADNDQWRHLYFEDVEIHADDIWPKIDYDAKGRLLAARKLAEARIKKNEAIPMLDGYGGEPVRLLALVCFELSQMVDPFWVSERGAAEIMGLEKEQGRDRARIVLKVLERRFRIISKAKKQGTKYHATRYKFTGRRPECSPESQKMPENSENPDDSR